MNDPKIEQEWLREFQSFLTTDHAPPESISRPLVAHIRSRLNPSFWSVLVKLGILQLSLGALTLLVCPQLGVGPAFGEHGLMYLFMHFGPIVCTAACGALFFGLSLFLGLLLIRPEEFRVVGRRRLVHIPVLSSVSLMLLMLVGASGTLLFYSAWWIGAVLAGEIGAEAAARTRFRRLSPGA
jgi:hypothetical protein